jgi:hypothetical protein
VLVGVADGVGVSVAVAVRVGVAVGVSVAVAVKVGVAVGDAVTVAVAVGTAVLVPMTDVALGKGLLGAARPARGAPPLAPRHATTQMAATSNTRPAQAIRADRR